VIVDTATEGQSVLFSCDVSSKWTWFPWWRSTFARDSDKYRRPRQLQVIQ